MTSVERAMELVMSTAKDFGAETIPIHESLNRTLREPILADRDFPPFDRVAMDGIAICFDQFDHQSRCATIEGVAAAGSPQVTLGDNKNCIEVMTGSVLPIGADTVIRYEDVTIENGSACVSDVDLKKGQNVHTKGLDRSQGEEVISIGTKISPAEIGVLATVGKPEVSVSKQPRCVIISSGNELVDIDSQPASHQIRKSNVYQIWSLLSALGLQSRMEHLEDDERVIKDRLQNHLTGNDVIIISGGVSKGKFDFIPGALESLGVEKLFHKVEQRPGKPFWFGKHPSGPVIFALPGNPVSSFMCAAFYLIPWLNKSTLNAYYQESYAILSEDVIFKPNLTLFLQIKLQNKEGRVYATPAKGKGSGDLANLIEADGFLVLPPGTDQYKGGSVFRYVDYRSIT